MTAATVAAMAAMAAAMVAAMAAVMSAATAPPPSVFRWFECFVFVVLRIVPMAVVRIIADHDLAMCAFGVLTVQDAVLHGYFRYTSRGHEDQRWWQYWTLGQPPMLDAPANICPGSPF
jgi:hypothetical protein